jgi:uncharacterized membrane protein
MKRAHCFSVLAGASLLLLATEAHAWFNICNRGGVPISMVIAYKSGDKFMSKGWWNIASGSCITAVGGDLANRYYYLHGKDSEGMYVSGSYNFCVVTNRAFEIYDAESCSGTNREWRGFREIDTGDSLNYTYNIYDR